MLRGNVVYKVREWSVEERGGVSGAYEPEVMISCKVDEAVEQEWSRRSVQVVVAREGLTEGSVEWGGQSGESAVEERVSCDACV